MPTAYSLLPDRFADGRHRALKEGLRRLGYRLREGDGRPTDERDLLITWTVHRGMKQQARDRFEAAGGRVVVAEEAHLRRVPNGPYPRESYFSLCLHDHQHSWRAGGPERWSSWNIAPVPWRRGGERVLVRAQRGIGSATMASPPGWHEWAAARLRRLSARPVEILPHPKTLKRAGRPAADLKTAWCVVTWASGLAAVALIAGVPVIACAPHGFVKSACGSRLEQVNEPPRPMREAAFARFAWAQWAMSEIRSGEAFAWLLR